MLIRETVNHEHWNQILQGAHSSRSRRPRRLQLKLLLLPALYLLRLSRNLEKLNPQRIYTFTFSRSDVDTIASEIVSTHQNGWQQVKGPSRIYGGG